MNKLKSIALIMALLVVTAPIAMAQSYTSETESTIVELAEQTDNLSTLVKAVKAAGLVETLNSEGPFTVFAPTNQAFADLPEGTLEMLLMPENQEKLQSILTYHVVPGKIMSSDLEDGMWVKTVQGNKIKITLSDNGAMVNSASIVKADIKASNGVIHIIDAVIMPMDSKKMDHSKMDYNSHKEDSDW